MIHNPLELIIDWIDEVIRKLFLASDNSLDIFNVRLRSFSSALTLACMTVQDLFKQPIQCSGKGLISALDLANSYLDVLIWSINEVLVRCFIVLIWRHTVWWIDHMLRGLRSILWLFQYGLLVVLGKGINRIAWTLHGLGILIFYSSPIHQNRLRISIGVEKSLIDSDGFLNFLIRSLQVLNVSTIPQTSQLPLLAFSLYPWCG